ncbi:MAG: helix-turn-helix domain-containing protein [Gammaproteobacteria bacterium]|nr:MAG: helix-turn-helix domain-containing protein [Gammaproteobacteria bacterium]
MSLAQGVSVLLMPGHCLISAAHAIKGLTDMCLLQEESWPLPRVFSLGPSESGAALCGSRPDLSARLTGGIVLVGGNDRLVPESQVQSWLREQFAHMDWGWATGAAAAWLVEAGVITQGKVSVPEQLVDRGAVSPWLNVSGDLFSVNGVWTTCRAGTAIQDVLLFWAHRWMGADVARALAHGWVQERVGGAPSHERRLPDKVAEREAPLLIEAIRLMESNLEEPLSTEDLAGHLKISRRQLERWFRRYLDTVPSRYYKDIRLEAARERVRAGDLPFSEIAAACGFSSPAHFATAYRERYGCTPSQDREKVSRDKI